MGLSYITELSKYGSVDDQMSNQFEVYFLGPSVLNIQEMALRMDRSIDIPKRSVAKTEISYQGVKIPKLTSNEETDKTITLNFRLDQNWMVYNTLNIWYGRTHNPYNGSMKKTEERSVTMLFRAFKNNKDSSRDLVFKHVQIMSIKLSEFDHTSNEPIRVECEFIFAYIQDFINDFFIR
jgi:hypothetical protein